MSNHTGSGGTLDSAVQLVQCKGGDRVQKCHHDGKTIEVALEHVRATLRSTNAATDAAKPRILARVHEHERDESDRQQDLKEDDDSNEHVVHATPAGGHSQGLVSHFLPEMHTTPIVPGMEHDITAVLRKRQMREGFSDRESLIARVQMRSKYGARNLPRGRRAGSRLDAGSESRFMVLAERFASLLRTLKRRAVTGKHRAYIVLRDPSEAVHVAPEWIVVVVGKFSDRGRNVFEQVIAGNEDTCCCIEQADMAIGVTWSGDNLPASIANFQHIACDCNERIAAHRLLHSCTVTLELSKAFSRHAMCSQMTGHLAVILVGRRSPHTRCLRNGNTARTYGCSGQLVQDIAGSNVIGMEVRDDDTRNGRWNDAELPKCVCP